MVERSLKTIRPRWQGLAPLLALALLTACAAPGPRSTVGSAQDATSPGADPESRRLDAKPESGADVWLGVAEAFARTGETALALRALSRIGPAAPPDVAERARALEARLVPSGAGIGRLPPTPGYTPQGAAAAWPRQAPRRIALLLPLSGPLRPAGLAVRSGFLSVNDEQLSAPQVRVHDTGGTPGAVLTAYRRATSGGADLVVGPLTRQGVTVLATAGPLPVPVLTLNRPLTGGTWPPHMVVFDLAPDNDARRVAEAMRADGHRRAAVLASATPRGRHMTAAFARRFETLGGQIVRTGAYAPRSARLRDRVRRFLAGDGGAPLWHDGRAPARQGMDALFLQGGPRDARLIRPLLRFLRAGDLPVYATGEVYSDGAGPRLNQDLDGVTVCDQPAALTAAVAGRGGDTLRLHALGADAYRLSRHLGALVRHSLTSISGATGTLHVNDHGRVVRRLACVPFRNGRPLMPTSPEGPRSGFSGPIALSPTPASQSRRRIAGGDDG